MKERRTKRKRYKKNERMPTNTHTYKKKEMNEQTKQREKENQKNIIQQKQSQ